MKYKRLRKKALISGMLMLSLCGLSACKQKPNENGSLKAEDGRSYGGLIKGEQGKKVSTAFFDMTLDSAEKSSTYQFEDGLYQADAGNAYLVVTLTIQNTYEKDLPMAITDFTLNFDGNEATEVITGFGKLDLNKEEFMENVFTLKKGESITKSILFTVVDKDSYRLCYSEYYDDKFEGDAYEITFQPAGATAEPQPAEDAQPEEGQPAEDGQPEGQSEEGQPAEDSQPEGQSEEGQPAEDSQPEGQPEEGQPDENQAAEDQPAEDGQ